MLRAANIMRTDAVGDQGTLMLHFGGGLPTLYCDGVNFQSQKLRFMRSEGSVKNLGPVPAPLRDWGLSIYGTFQKIDSRVSVKEKRDMMAKEFQDRFGIALDASWVLVIRKGVVRLSNGKAEIQEDCYGVNLRTSKGSRPCVGTELTFGDQFHNMLMPMTEVLNLIQNQMGRLVDPLAWQKQAMPSRKTTEVLVIGGK
jgi:hypothetical protein